MKQINLPNYNTVQPSLEEAGLKIHASQLHGLIAGVLVGNKDAVDPKEVEKRVSGELDLGKVDALFKQMTLTSQQQLVDFLFEFEMLLPEDDSSLTARAEGLTVWCQGFLTGLTLANVSLTALEQETDEIKEAIGDLLEISKMKYEDVVTSEEDEAAYVELVEYVRMAAILMYQEWHETQSEQAQKASSKYLH